MEAVSAVNQGWHNPLDTYNMFCSDRRGIPLWNQTTRLTGPLFQWTVGARVRQFAEVEATYHLGNRFINPIFKEMFGE